jgi:hypothetical protein
LLACVCHLTSLTLVNTTDFLGAFVEQFTTLKLVGFQGYGATDELSDKRASI